MVNVWHAVVTIVVIVLQIAFPALLTAQQHANLAIKGTIYLGDNVSHVHLPVLLVRHLLHV